MRQEMEIPALRNLTKFLATALTFSRSLAHIELYLDDRNLCTIKKVVSPAAPISIPSELSTVTSGKIFRINTVESSSVQITATYVNATQIAPAQTNVGSKIFSFFSKEEPKLDPLASQTSNIFLRVLTGSIQSSLKSSFAAELQRATKKPAPKTTNIQIVTVNAAEYASSTSNAPIFESLSTYPGQGRVYIGFPTHQTIGFSGHVGAPCLIPTVERESIDLVDRYIKIWNFEVLRAIGLLARISYHTEYAQVKTNHEAIHTMKFFTMRTATPQRIDQTVEEAFFTSNAVSVLSTQGVRSSTQTRLPDNSINFLKSVPILSVEVHHEAKDFIDKLSRLGYIEAISIGDIKADIQNRVLSTPDGIQFLKYCAKISSIDRAALATLLKAAIIDVGEAHFNAGQVATFSTKAIPPNVPLPIDAVPSQISEILSIDDLKALHWTELSLIDWLDFIVHRNPLGPKLEKDINKDPDFAAIVLAAISKNYDALFADDRERAVQLLKERTCIPTKAHGMQRPDQTYFNSIKMFDDLPLALSIKGVKEKFLATLGVRKTVELDIIFNRLVTGGSWTTSDVIHYLASVKRDIPSKDIERLKSTPLAIAEGSTEKQRANQLYEPNETLRSLSLPIISWKGPWRQYSEEATLLYQLGLRKFPPPSTLIELAASKDVSVRERALNYFLLNFAAHGYGAAYQAGQAKHAFVPTTSGKLAKPVNVFTDPACAIFDLEIIRKDLLGEKARILGVQASPSVEVITELLIHKPPVNQVDAMNKFSFFARMQPVFSREDRARIGNLNILPIEKNGKVIRMSAPNRCFFKSADVDSLFNEIFDFVDYGSQANHLLRSIGVRDYPSTVQIATMLVNDTATVWKQCADELRYQKVLLQLARNFDDIKKDRALFQKLRQSRFLLAYKYVLLGNKQDEADEANLIIHTSLQRASDVVIVDDIIAFNLFRTDVYTSPESALIEEMYAELGAPRLSSVVLERATTSGRSISNETTEKLKADLIERLTVFMSDPSIRSKRDIKWLQSNLKVTQVDQVGIQRELRFGAIHVSKQTKTTAIIAPQGHTQVLTITKDPDNYDIAVAVCKFLLTASKPGDYLLLDSLLTKSLKTLKARGYNVDRILQKQEKERQERKVHDEEANRKYEEEQARLQEKERANQVALQPPPVPVPKMPGGFPEKPKSLLSGWKSAVGLKPVKSVVPQITQAVQAPQHTAGTRQAEDPVTSQAKIESTIQSAIQATRNSNTTSINQTPRTDTVSEAATYCDAKPAQNLMLAATLANGMQLMLDKTMDASITLPSYSDQIAKFSTLLETLKKEVFGIQSGINIFLDSSGGTIAFNQAGTIYCNLRFYSQLHTTNNDAVIYWFITICHEIAHNLVSEHSSEHEFYMESLITLLMPKTILLLNHR